MLESAHLTYGDQVLFIGVDSRDERGAALRFVANVGITYPQVFDAKARFAASVGTIGIPYTVIVDASGSIVYRQFGKTTAETLRAALAQAGVTVATSDRGASRSPLVQPSPRGGRSGGWHPPSRRVETSTSMIWPCWLTAR